MSEFQPVRTLQDLMTLDSAEIVSGYSSGRAGDKEPTNCTRSFWHGWRNGTVDSGRRKIDEAGRQLASEVVKVMAESGKTFTDIKRGVHQHGKGN